MGDVVGGISGGVGGVLGTAVGGLAGGLAKGASTTGYQAKNPGLWGNDERRERFAAAIEEAKRRNAAENQFRQGQNQLVGQLQQTAQGQGPSVAGAMLNQAQDQNMAQANAMAASARGDVNPALLQRNVMNNMAQGQQQIAQQASVMKAQEAQNAQALLAQALQQGRGQDIQFQQQKDDLVKYYESLGLSAEQAELNANMEAQKINAGIETSNTQGKNQFVGGMISGAAGAGAMAASDENLKTGVKDGKKSMYAFLDAVKAHQYKYKDEKWGKGTQHSVMAQELEKTPVGKAMVMNTHEGKIVDYGKGFGAILAAQASIHQRLKEIEKRGKN